MSGFVEGAPFGGLPVPDGVGDDVAAALLLQGLTAHYLVTSTFPVTAGQDVLLHAGAGGVGSTGWSGGVGAAAGVRTAGGVAMGAGGGGGNRRPAGEFDFRGG